VHVRRADRIYHQPDLATAANDGSAQCQRISAETANVAHAESYAAAHYVNNNVEVVVVAHLNKGVISLRIGEWPAATATS
jgi:hypothetical protein